MLTVTRHTYGKGIVYYVGTQPDRVCLKKLLGDVIDEAESGRH